MIEVNVTHQYKIIAVTISDSGACTVEISEMVNEVELRRMTVEASPAETATYLSEGTLTALTEAAYRLAAVKLQL